MAPPHPREVFPAVLFQQQLANQHANAGFAPTRRLRNFTGTEARGTYMRTQDIIPSNSNSRGITLGQLLSVIQPAHLHTCKILHKSANDFYLPRDRWLRYYQADHRAEKVKATRFRGWPAIARPGSSGPVISKSSTKSSGEPTWESTHWHYATGCSQWDGRILMHNAEKYRPAAVQARKSRSRQLEKSGKKSLAPRTFLEGGRS